MRDEPCPSMIHRLGGHSLSQLKTIFLFDRSIPVEAESFKTEFSEPETRRPLAHTSITHEGPLMLVLQLFIWFINCRSFTTQIGCGVGFGGIKGDDVGNVTLVVLYLLFDSMSRNATNMS
jgi:hypothetical protein